MAIMLFQNIISTAFMALLCLSFSFYPFGVAEKSGTATFYTAPYVPSACYGYQDEGVMIAAGSDGIYKGGKGCGEYYKVTCVGGTNQGTPNPCLGSGSVVVKIVDLCPPASCRGIIDLSQEAFSAIADTNAGVIDISYKKV